MKKKKIHLFTATRQLIQEFEKGKWYKQAALYLTDKEKMRSLLGLVVHMFRNKALAPVLKDLVLLYFYVSDIVGGRYKDYNTGKLLMIVAVLIYVVSPLDLIPDFIPFTGFLDDAALIGFAFKTADKELTRYYQWSHARRKPQEPEQV